MLNNNGYTGMKSNKYVLHFKIMLCLLLLNLKALHAIELEHGANSAYYDGFYSIINTQSGIVAVGEQGINEDSSQGIIHFMNDKGKKIKEVKVRSPGANISVLLDLIEIESGDFIAVGWRKNSKQSKEDAWVIRFDTNGEIIWNHSFGNSRETEIFNFVDILENGQILVGGKAQTASARQGGTADGIALILDQSDGKAVTGKRFGIHITRAAFYDGVATSDGGYVLAGWATDPQTGEDNAWIVRVSGSHDQIWQKICGGSKTDLAYSIIQDSHGDFIAFGWGTQEFSDDLSGLVAKIPSSGENCELHFFDVGREGNDRFYFGTQLKHGGFLAIGRASTSSQNYTAWYAIINSELELDSQGLLEDQPKTRYYGATRINNDRYLFAGLDSSKQSSKSDGLLVRLALPIQEELSGILELDLDSNAPWDFDEQEKTFNHGVIDLIEEYVEISQKLKAVDHKFRLTKDSWLVASIVPSSVDLDLELTGPDGFIASSNHRKSAAEFIEQYLRTGTYTLTVTIPEQQSNYNIYMKVNSQSLSTEFPSSSHLEVNSSDKDKVQVERLLQYIGFEPGRVDGIFGSQTRNAIRAFQLSMNQKPTGSLDEQERLKLAIDGSIEATKLAKQIAQRAAQEAQQANAIITEVGDWHFRGNQFGLYKNNNKSTEFLGKVTNNNPNGLGMLRNLEENTAYIGSFENGKLQFGILINISNQTPFYVGELGNYEDNSIWGFRGYGAEYDDSGSVNSSGYWEADTLIEDIPLSNY